VIELADAASSLLFKEEAPCDLYILRDHPVVHHRHCRRVGANSISFGSRMASVIEASGEMHTGSGVMTSAALMASPPHLNFAHI
jgi:hypothetical protein